MELLLSLIHSLFESRVEVEKNGMLHYKVVLTGLKIYLK